MNLYGFEIEIDEDRIKIYEDLSVVRIKVNNEEKIKNVFSIYIGDNSKIESNEKRLLISKDDKKIIVKSPCINEKDIEGIYFEINKVEDLLMFSLINGSDKKNVDVSTIIQNGNNIVEENNVDLDSKEDVTYNFESKEIIVRKEVSKFIERLCMNIGYEIKHDDYKKIIYREKKCEDLKESLIKNYYDSFVYLISDYKNALTTNRLKNFIYLITNREIDETKIKQISNIFYYGVKGSTGIDDLIELCVKNIDLIKDNLDEKELYIIQNMLIKYLLAYQGIEVNATLFDCDIEDYKKEIENNKLVYSKEYYKSLKKIDKKDIKEALLKLKDVIQEKYLIEHIFIYGSFMKKERIDSDIDIMISYSLDASTDMKKECNELIKEKLFKELGRYIDINPNGKNVSDEMIVKTDGAELIW